MMKRKLAEREQESFRYAGKNRSAGKNRRTARQRKAKMSLLASALIIPLFMGLLVFNEGRRLELQYETDRTVETILEHYEQSRAALSEIEYLQSYSGSDTFLARERDESVQELAAAELQAGSGRSE